MVVTCKNTDIAGVRLGRGFSAERAARLERGKSYVVLGLQLEIDSLLWGTGAWLQLAVGEAELLVVPLALFDVVEGRVSAHWEARGWEDGSLTLWPASFYVEYYRSDLAAGKEETVADFRRVRHLLEAEAHGER